MIEKTFWKGKKVLVTGHTGFKGSWLCLWLQSLGAKVVGYALNPPTNPNLFSLCLIENGMKSIIGDIRDKNKLSSTILNEKPDLVFHMAAQPLVRNSYEYPVETYEVNVLGTVYLLDAIKMLNKKRNKVTAVINITSDKCYENKEWVWGYREHEPLGGYDPYSNSKACSELVISSYRDSFFNPKNYEYHKVGIASVRAGNVIGGGDWAKDRLIPECVEAYLNRTTISLRNPEAIRPWQHVLEPLGGYLLLAQKLYMNGTAFSGAWNFGPDEIDCKSVQWVVKNLCKKFGDSFSYNFNESDQPHEAHYLKLDCSKAKVLLGWKPRWDLNIALEKVVEWAKAFEAQKNLRHLCLKQINEYNSTLLEETS